MTVGDWLVVIGGIAGLAVATALLAVGVTRAIRSNGFFSGGFFRRPAAPWTVYALLLAAAALTVLFVWIFLPRDLSPESRRSAAETARLDVGWTPSARPARIGEMRPLRYSINVTLDGCVHHEAGLPPDAESMDLWTGEMSRADALLFGRVTYQMMESAWRKPAAGAWPSWMSEQQIRFAETIDQAEKYVVSSMLQGADWNTETIRGDVKETVERLKQQPGGSLWVGGVTLPRALTDLGLIDEYEFVVQPILAGHGPTLLAGVRERIRLELAGRRELQSGAMALTYRPA